MYIVKTDPHTHTLISGHAFGTIGENARCAAANGMEAISMSDHFSPHFLLLKDGAPPYSVTTNMDALPKVIEGVRVLASAEIDIVDHEGRLYGYNLIRTQNAESNVLKHLLDTRDVAIASVHGFDGSQSGTIAENTRMYINAISTPGVQILGHIGRAGLPFEIDTVLAAAKERKKLIEINEHSFDFGEGVCSLCQQIAERCAELGASIVVSSDAHSPYMVGLFDRALQMLEKIHFPQALIANATLATLLEAVADANQLDHFH
ncbi:MAG: PHP domain-containing protein [Clostridia bacterium]